MFGLARLLRRNGGAKRTQRRPIRRTLLTVAELEERIVPTLLGQQLFPADYPWNQNISNAPVAANSAAIISHIGSSIHVHPDWGQDSASNGNSPLYGIPFNVVHGNTTAKVSVVIDNYPGESDILPVPIPANAVIEGDFQNGPNPNVGSRGDSHLLVWDEDNNVAYELYLASRPSENADGKWHAGQESVWDMKTDSFRSLGWTSADAAGLSILAGLARPDEGLPAAQGGQGVINHALRFTLPSGDVNPQYLYPASHMVNDSSGSTKLPFGARLRLMNTPAVNAVINAMGPEAQIIAHAMQQYGLVVADIGSAMYVTGSSASEDANNTINFTWDMNDVLGLSSLNAGDFQVVNLTPVVTGLSASSGSAGNSITITGQNFSGAAGHLAVFFGSTAATSVTFVDDAHLTAVVPNGSGTVNVTVQSGVNETDPNNPNDNVNNPIFGYGTSAVVAASQFTYGSGPTISGTNSTASFATPTVASGNTDTLTVVVKDTAGNAVSGLASGAFGFALSGGSSAGTFGTVTASATAGTYTVTFTGTTAGTTSTLTTTVSGVKLAGAAVNITVTPANAIPVVVGQLGSRGVWEYNRAAGTWTQLTPANATLLADDPQGAVAGEFPGSGVWEYLPGSGWKQLTTVDAAALVMDAQGEVTGEFQSAGVWQYTPGSGWKQLTTVDAALLAAGAAGKVAGEFRGAGVWQYLPASGWKQLTPSDAALLVMDAQGDVAGEFAGAGVWQYTPAAGWKQLTASNAAALAAGASGEVVGEFQGAGVWRYLAASGWGQLTPADAARLGDADGSVTGAFTGSGVWELDPGSGWFQLTATDVSVLVVS